MSSNRAGQWTCAAIFACLTALGSGCVTTQDRSVQSAQVTQEQQQWWSANRERAVLVAGKGYAIDGVPGFFDQYGRPITDTPIVDPKKNNKDGLAGAITQTSSTSPVAPTNPSVQPLPPTGPTTSTADIVSTPEPEKPVEGWDKLDPSYMKKQFMKAIGQGPNHTVALTAMNEGEELFRKAKYKEAAKKFDLVTKRWPDSALEEDALFMLAESYFFSDQYPWASDTYAELVKKYTNTRYLDKSVARQFAIGRYWDQDSQAHPHWPVTPNFTDRSKPVFDEYGHAQKAYEDVHINDPRGPLAADAIMATANSFFVRGHYEDADYYYTMLRKEYPHSEFLAQAYQLGLQAKLRKYQGPAYSGKPLEEADELINQMLTQIPGLEKERERLLTTKGEVRAQRALRDWQLADYYDRGAHYGAARYYYAVVAKEYPNTQFAQQAQTRLGLIADKPAEKPDNFAWFEKYFDRRQDIPTIAEKQAPAGTGTVLR